MALTVTIIVFLLVATGFLTLFLAVQAPVSATEQRLRALFGDRMRQEQKVKVSERMEGTWNSMSKLVPKSPKEVSRTRVMLMQAGYRYPRHLAIYFGVRTGLVLLAVIFAVGSNLAAFSPLMLIALPVFAHFLPRFLLKRRVRNRQLDLTLALPDALDLMTICVEAGLSLDQALLRVSQELRVAHPVLSDELNLVHLETRAGKSRTEALRNLVDRTGVEDLRALVAVLVQTDRFGTSITQALRVHSDSLRVKRRQRAEEAAAKTTIKMVPVLVFFVFPAMFFVSLGPAAIRAMRELLPGLNQ